MRFWVGLVFISLVFAQVDSFDKETFRNDFLAGELSWEEIQEQAKIEGEVNWFYWGGSEELNTWIDTVVVPDLAKLGIKLNSSRIVNTRDAVDLILAEVATGHEIGQGSVDAIWINGENFFSLASQELTFGSFADKLPNSKYFFLDPEDTRAKINLYDLGYPTKAHEIPWSGEQYICTIDTARLPSESAPKDFQDLAAYLKQNPSRFTYIKPPHFEGNTFVQSVLYAFNPDGTTFEPFQLSAEELGVEEFTRIATPGFEFLKGLEPFLLGGSGKEGKRGSPIYPENGAVNETLFVNGEVDMFCRFGVYDTAIGIENGSLPETARNIIFPQKGMLTNKSFITIPINSPHPSAALVLANYLSEPSNQISKLATVGFPIGLDTPLLSKEEQLAVAEAAPSLQGVNLIELADAAVPDTNALLIDIIEQVWIDYIERQIDKPLEDIIQSVF